MLGATKQVKHLCVCACVRVCVCVLVCLHWCMCVGICEVYAHMIRPVPVHVRMFHLGQLLMWAMDCHAILKYWVRCHGAERPQQDPKKSDCTPITFPATYFGRGPFILSDSEKHIQIIIIWMISSKQDRNKVPFAKILSEIISSKIGRVIVCHWTKKPYTLSLLGWEEGLGL